MDKENQNSLRRLSEQLKSSVGIIPFIGAGLSQPFGYPVWTSFLIEQARSFDIEKKIEEFSRAVASVMIPMINSLGALSLEEEPASAASGEAT